VIGLVLLLYISALLAGAYLAIRWVLKPLQWLKLGVEQVGRGDLSHRVPLKRSDELRDLAKAFNTMAERLQQLIRSKEQLLLDVSHELRSPITRMKVALAMMPETRDRISLEEDLRELEEKITELLDTARWLNVEAVLNIEMIDLADLIRLTAKQFHGGRPPVHVARLADVGTVHIDRDRIGKAIRNILENAQKYSPDDSAPIVVSMRSTPDAVAVSVRDSGVGIPAEDINFIFEPFYRVDKARSPQTEGYGLGLSLARTIIEAHGGRIEVNSTLGQGTEVVVLLPHSVEDVSSAQGSP
jgi:signal transduction histidine kinase